MGGRSNGRLENEMALRFTDSSRRAQTGLGPGSLILLFHLASPSLTPLISTLGSIGIRCEIEVPVVAAVPGPMTGIDGELHEVCEPSLSWKFIPVRH